MTSISNPSNAGRFPNATAATGHANLNQPIAQPIEHSIQQLRQDIHQALEECRAGTLNLFAGVDPAMLCRQAHPDFSPIGWHLGHIGYTESLWILQRTAGQSPLSPQYHRLFAADGLPKGDRVYLPDFSSLCDYLHTIRHHTLAYLQTAPVDQQQRLWRWLLQHESQHAETITLILQLLRPVPSALPTHPPTSRPTPSPISMPACSFQMGDDSIDAMDNEQPPQWVQLAAYVIDPYPVTCGQYREFMAAGGYGDLRWWSVEGWQWLQQHPVTQPLYWAEHPAWDDHPVCGVSYYEAEAYATFVGKRLPTEAEWENAARSNLTQPVAGSYPWGDAAPDTADYCNYGGEIGWTTPVTAYPAGRSACGCWDMLGNVWEWTGSWFEGYPGFVAYPYPGYSQAYFDGEHRVLRGGSWATRSWALRSPFRNWYHPGVRQILAGFRCANTVD